MFSIEVSTGDFLKSTRHLVYLGFRVRGLGVRVRGLGFALSLLSFALAFAPCVLFALLEEEEEVQM